MGTGTGNAIAEAISAWAGNPKADAEAENFRTTSAFNKLKLSDAERASQRDKDLDVHRAGWKSLTEDTEVDDPNGEIEVLDDGLGVNPKKVKKEAAFKWDQDGMHFKFDQSRVADFLKHGTALYGPDFFTKWHPFLTKAAPDYTGKLKVTGAEANVLSRLGFEGHPSAMPLSQATKDNMINRSLASEIAAGRGDAGRTKDTGVTQDPAGNIIVGPNHPSNQEEPDGETEGSFAPTDEIPSSEPNETSSEEASAPPIGPVVDAQDPVYKSDIASQIANKGMASPGSKPEILPDGRRVYKRQAPVSGPTPQEQQAEWSYEHKTRGYPTQADKERAIEDHGKWVAGLPKSIASFITNQAGQTAGAKWAGEDPSNNVYANAIALHIANVEQKLEAAGYDTLTARRLAVEKAAEIYKSNFDTNWEMFGINRAKRSDEDVSPQGVVDVLSANMKQQLGDLPSKSLFADRYMASGLVSHGLDGEDLKSLPESEAREIQKHAIHIGFLKDILRKVRTNGGRYLEEAKDGLPVEKRMTEANLSETERKLREHQAYLDALIKKSIH